MMPVSTQSAHRHWIDQTRNAQLGTHPIIGLIAVKDLYDRDSALRAGRLWQRLHLQGTLVGLGMQPLNQLPECVDRERQLGRSVDLSRRPRRFQRRRGVATHFRIPGGMADTARASESAPQLGVGADAPEPRRFVTCLLLSRGELPRIVFRDLLRTPWNLKALRAAFIVPAPVPRSS